MSRIVELIAENVKRIKAIAIKPDGNTVIIGGNNKAGKSSVLDSIVYALGGKNAICDEPLRKGTEKGYVVCELDDFIVKRTFSANGNSTLTITSKDNQMEAKQPQKLLDQLVGKLTFDPLYFMRQKPIDQINILKDLRGIDFSDLDATEKRLYDERKDVNKEIKIIDGQLVNYVEPEEGWKSIPDDVVSFDKVKKELEDAKEHNNKINEKRLLQKVAETKVRNLELYIDDNEKAIDRLKQTILELEEKIKAKISAIEKYTSDLSVENNNLAAINKEVLEFKPIDTDTIMKKFDSIMAINTLIEKKKEYSLKVAHRNGLIVMADELTKGLKEIPAKKQKLISEAQFPIDGLTFDEVVRINNIPFDQCSSAEQTYVSVAIGFAMNPKLKVLLVRGGSLLDDESLALVKNMAEKYDAQIWIERVGKDKECQIIIEDGMSYDNDYDAVDVDGSMD